MMVRWTGNVGETRNAYILVEKPDGRDHLGHVGVDINGSELEKCGVRMCIGFILLMTGPVAGFCVHGNEPSSSIKGG
jgi:hypothetical protein